MSNIVFSPPPTCRNFMNSTAFGRLIAGPVGSGKTTACLFELFRRACEQAPADDGLRYTRFAVLRQTLKQLKDTVLKDIIQWIGPVANYKVSDNTIYIDAGDVRSEWLLIPLEDPEDQRRLLSMQLTGAWLSEAIEMDVGLVAAVGGRMPRYPSGNKGVASWTGIIADTNFPPEGSDWHKFMELDTPPDWQIFKQPGGLSEGAENYEWLNQTAETLKLPENHPARLLRGRQFYERNARNTNVDWVRRYVHAQYGDDPSGTAVFRESFRTAFHVADELEPVPGHPLLIGQDFGRDPCTIICQLDHKGRLLVLDEVPAEDIGLEQHIVRAVRPKLMDPRYLSRPVAMVGDPAGMAKSTIYEETSFDSLKRMGFMAFPAPTNDLDPRLRAVEAFLGGSRDGGPALLVDRSRCPQTVRALSGGYRYEKTKSGQRKPAPAKNQFSHMMDALQYVALVAHGGMAGVITHKLRTGGRRTLAPRVGAGGWT
jgi:hypothetical protein